MGVVVVEQVRSQVGYYNQWPRFTLHQSDRPLTLRPESQVDTLGAEVQALSPRPRSRHHYEDGKKEQAEE